MAKNPTMTAHGANLLNALNFYHRNGQYPLDDTSLWNTLAEFEEYIGESGSYRYPGQLVSITNGDAYDEANEKVVSLAIVRPNGQVQKVGEETIFENKPAAEAFVKANPDFAVAGKTLTVKAADGQAYELYVIKTDKSLLRVSFEASDIPEVTWEALTGKPKSAVGDIDAAVTLSKKFTDGDHLSYNGEQLAKVTDIPTTYDALKITGTIKVENLPQTAMERMYVATNDEARLALTTAQVQNGDVVKVEDSGLMYYVKDESKLGGDTAEQAFEKFTAGAASTVPWSGVTATPDTLAGYGITDAVNVSELAGTYGADGKVVTWKQGTDANQNTYEIEGKAKAAALADVATKAKDSEKFGGQAPAHYATADALATLDGTVSGHTGELATLTQDMGTAKTDITNLKSGEAITALAASKLTGVIAPENLPDSVKTHVKDVNDQDARFALTSTDVQEGDVVKQLDTGALYFVRDVANLSSETGYEQISVTSIAWDKVTGKPTTVAASGLTDAVAKGDITTAYGAGKIVGWEQGTNTTTQTQYDINGTAKKATEADQATKALDADKLGGQLPAYYAEASKLAAAEGEIQTIKGQIGEAGTSGILKDIADLKSGEAITKVAATKIEGVLDISNIPNTVIERLSIVKDDEARLALTKDTVQNGDSVKVQDTGKMYYVKDDTKLGTGEAEQAFEPYTVGSAASVPWSGVTGKPDTLTGYGITDAVNASEKVTEANAGNAGKILVLNAEGKLDVDITGAVAWDKITDKPTSSVQDIDAAVATATHTNRAVLDALSDSNGELAYNGVVLAKKSDVEKNTSDIARLGLGALTVVDDVSAAFPEAGNGQMALEKIPAAKA